MSPETVLLVIDAQRNMFEPPTAVFAAEEVLTRIQDLIGRARAAGVPAVYVQHSGGPGDPDEPGTPGWEIDSRLTPHPGEVTVQKRTPNAFYQTDLQEQLQRLGARHLILCGMQSELCVDTTCRHAFALEYQVTLVADAHSTFDGAVLNAAQIIAHHNALLRTFADVRPAHTIDFASL